MINTDQVKEWIKIKERRKAIKDEDDDLILELEALERTIIAAFGEDGLQRLTIDGRTVSMRREVWASAGGDTPGLAAGLRAAGLDELVNDAVHGGRLSSWVRDIEREAGGEALAPEALRALLPEPVRPAITISEVWKLGMRAS